MRIGEIAVLGPNPTLKRKFIEAIADDVCIENDALLFGRLKIDRQLMLHFYGLNLTDKHSTLAWDLLSRKFLGHILLFDWHDPTSRTTAQKLLDFVISRYTMPIVVAAHGRGFAARGSQRLSEAGVHIGEQTHFMFCEVSDRQSVRNVVLRLVDTALEHLAQS